MVLAESSAIGLWSGVAVSTMSCSELRACRASPAEVAAMKSSVSAVSGFALRDGEPVDFIAGGKTVPGTLHVLKDGGIYRAYWQPQGRPERYVLANAGTDAVRLIATPAQGTPATDGMPGTTLNAQQVLSCPTL